MRVIPHMFLIGVCFSLCITADVWNCPVFVYGCHVKKKVMAKGKKINYSEGLPNVWHNSPGKQCYECISIYADALPDWCSTGLIARNLAFSWAKIFCFRAVFQCPVFLNIAMVAFGVRELVFVKMTVPSRWFILWTLWKMLLWRNKSEFWVLFV